MDTSSALMLSLLQRDNTTGPIDCTTEYSTDYYGFGVRLGVYFAWLSSYFANTLLPGEISGSLDTNTIFLLALLISLFQGTHSHKLYQIDGLVVLHLASGFLFSCLSVWGYRTLHYQREGAQGIKNFGGVGTHCRLVLIAAIAIYGAWFWIEGVQDGLKHSEQPGCERIYTWFFYKWLISGGIHIFMAVLTTLTSVYYSFMCIAAAVAIGYALSSSGWKKWQAKMKRVETGLHVEELKFMYNIMRGFNIIWIIFCAIQVELTLVYNNVQEALVAHANISAPAQLLPLLIGTLTFARTLWLIILEHGASIMETLRAESAGMEPPSHAQNVRRGFHLSIQRFISPLSGEVPHRNREASVRTHTPFNERPWHQRYLVAYLPWLSIFGFWRKIVDEDQGLPTKSTSSEPTLNMENDKQPVSFSVEG